MVIWVLACLMSFFTRNNTGVIILYTILHLYSMKKLLNQFLFLIKITGELVIIRSELVYQPFCVYFNVRKYFRFEFIVEYFYFILNYYYILIITSNYGNHINVSCYNNICVYIIILVIAILCIFTITFTLVI